MRHIRHIAIILSFLFLQSCKTPPKKHFDVIKTDKIEQISEKIDSSANKQVKINNVIEKQAKKITGNDNQEPKEAIIDAVVRSNEGIIPVLAESAKDMASLKKELDAMTKKITKIHQDNQKELEKKDAEIERLNNSLMQSIKTKLWYAIALGILMITAALVMFFNGNTKSIGLGIAGLSLVAVTLTVSFLIQHIIWVVLSVLIAIALIIYKAYDARRDNKAVEQLTETVDIIKPHIRKDKVSTLFDNDGPISAKQSKSTRSMVAKIRGKW